MRARVERRPTTDDADARVRLCRETTDDDDDDDDDAQPRGRRAF
jgi:hypothetical protein